MNRFTAASHAATVSVLGLILSAGTAHAQTFSEEALARGVNYFVTQAVEQLGAGIAMADLDNDGDLDLVTAGRIDRQFGIFENDGTGNFTSRTGTVGIPIQIRQSGVTAVDYDGDGDLDLHLTGYRVPDLLMRNDGNWTFTDVTAAAGVAGEPGGAPSFGSVWADYDNDGDLDAYVPARTGAFGNFNENRFYQNQGDGTFLEVAQQAGVLAPLAPTQIALWLDYDRDGHIDLYVGNDKGSGVDWWNFMYRNNGDGTFTDVTDATNTRANVDAMGFAIADMDFDGYHDIFQTNIVPGHVFLIHDGSGVFYDAAEEYGVEVFEVGWGTFFADFVNDTHVDLFMVHSTAEDTLFNNTGSVPFTDISEAAGCNNPGASYVTAAGDVNGDNLIDFAVQTHSSNISLYINTSENTGNFIRFNVVGEGKNPFAVGAEMELTSGGKTQLRTIFGGANYKATNEYTVHYGLGEETSFDNALIIWPATGVTRTLSNYPGNNTWTVYPPSRLGDGDHDGDIDATDIRAALAAFTGSGVGLITPGLEIYDMDGDSDIDADDLIAMGLGQAPKRSGTVNKIYNPGG